MQEKSVIPGFFARAKLGVQKGIDAIRRFCRPVTAPIGRALRAVDTFIQQHELLVLALLMAALFFVPLLPLSKVTVKVFTMILLYILLVESLNVVNGFSGQFNVGQAGFYCVGAYTAAILSTKYGVSFWVLLPVSGLMAAFVSLFLSVPTAKLKGMYFTIVTLGFSEIVRQLAMNWNFLTRGPRGISGIPAPSFFGLSYDRGAFFYYVLYALVLLMLFCTHRILKSRVGRSWLAMREDVQAAASLGIGVARYRMLNFAYSAFWAGVAGCVYAFFQRFISPDSFTLDESFNILAMNVIGGQGTLLGPVVGALVINGLVEILRDALQYRMLIYAALIILMMWIRPQGLVGAINRAPRRPREKSAGKGGGAK